MRLQDVLHRVAGPHLAKVAGRANVALLLGGEARAVADCPGRAEGWGKTTVGARRAGHDALYALVKVEVTVAVVQERIGR